VTSSTPETQSRRAFLALCAVAATGLVLSGIGPEDRLTWWLEVAPVIIAVHATILMLGGHYT